MPVLALLLIPLALATPPKGRSADLAYQEIVLGESHGCGLTGTGTVRCWGSNDRGQLGNGTFDDSDYALPVKGLTNVSTLTAGSFHTCAIRRDRTVACWGDNQSGQLGNGEELSAQSTPIDVKDVGPALTIAAGASHTCVVTTDRSVSCWGNNLFGQLGVPDIRNVPRPVPVPGLPAMTDIAAGYGHTCAIGPDQPAPWCWGDPQYGQLGRALPEYNDPQPPGPADGDFPEALRQVDARGHETCVLHGGGIQCWGAPPTDLTPNPAQREVVSERGLVQLSVGWGHGCALEATGTVVCFGDDRFGQLGRRNNVQDVVFGSFGVSEARGVTAGNGESCAARGKDLRSVCWGNYSREEQAEARAERPDIQVTKRPVTLAVPLGTEFVLAAEEMLEHDGARIRVDIATEQIHTCANTKVDVEIEVRKKRVTATLGDPFLPGGDCINAPAPAHAYVPLPHDAIGRRDLVVRWKGKEDFYQIYLRLNRVEVIPLMESFSIWDGDKALDRVPPGSLAISCREHGEDPVCVRRFRAGMSDCKQILSSARITEAPVPQKRPEASKWFTADPNATIISPDEGHAAYRTWFEETWRDGSTCLDIAVKTWTGETWRNDDPRNTH